MKHINRISMIVAMAAVFNIPSTLKAQEERTNVTTEENIFKLSLGPSLVTSKILMPVYGPTAAGVDVVSKLRMKNIGGLDIAATCQHLWRSGCGIGLDYVMGHTSLPQSYGHIDQHYIGPSFAYSYRGWKHFRLNAAFGYGYVRCRKVSNPAVKITPYGEPMRVSDAEIKEKENALGSLLRIGGAYRINTHWYANADISVMISSFEPDNEELDDATINDGIARFNLLIGASYHF